MFSRKFTLLTVLLCCFAAISAFSVPKSLAFSRSALKLPHQRSTKGTRFTFTELYAGVDTECPLPGTAKLDVDWSDLGFEVSRRWGDGEERRDDVLGLLGGIGLV